MRPTWAEVSLTALCHNYRTIQQHVSPSATVCSVVKADAYGHGAVPCARALEAEGATWFGVSSAEEGIALRQGGIRGRILLLSGFWRGEEDDIILNDLTPAVWEWWHLDLLEQAAARLGRRAQESVPVHLKVNTGMNRAGLDLECVSDFVISLRHAEHVVLEGVFSHLASAEVLGAPDVDAQLTEFEKAIATVRASGVTPVYYHIANSAAISTRQQSWKNLVRPGISLYGYYLPFTSVVSGRPDESFELPVKPVLSWKTRIVSTREVAARERIGYNGAYVTQAPTKIAMLPVGYGDGLNRHLSSRGRVIVRDQYAPIVGNVSMDITLIDVSNVAGVSTGDEVTLLGSTGRCSITAWEHANHAMTIPYEILCNISKRVRRKYVE
ncbi:MAG TPA: alanine racemase [Terriglobales bacterium]|nr:alanine racemase [Terriglobales bacterium]